MLTLLLVLACDGDGEIPVDTAAGGDVTPETGRDDTAAGGDSEPHTGSTDSGPDSADTGQEETDTGPVGGDDTGPTGDDTSDTGGTTPAVVYPLDDLLTLPDIQAKGTHNSYHLEPGFVWHPRMTWTSWTSPSRASRGATAIWRPRSSRCSRSTGC